MKMEMSRQNTWMLSLPCDSSLLNHQLFLYFKLSQITYMDHLPITDTTEWCEPHFYTLPSMHCSSRWVSQTRLVRLPLPVSRPPPLNTHGCRLFHTGFDCIWWATSVHPTVRILAASQTAWNINTDRRRPSSWIDASWWVGCFWKRKSGLLESSMSALQTSLNLVIVCSISAASVARFWNSQKGPESPEAQLRIIRFYV